MQDEIEGGVISCPYEDADYDMDYVIEIMEEYTHDLDINKHEYGVRLVIR